MNYDELLELKKEVDELSLYYRALKEKSREIDEKFYSNNLLDPEDDDTDLTEESIDALIEEGRSGYTFQKIAWYCARFGLIVMINAMFEMPNMIFAIAILTNAVYYAAVVLGYEKITRRELESKIENKKIDFEELASEKKEVDRRLEYVRDKYSKISIEYEKLVGQLEEEDYIEYLDYISEYLEFMLKHSEEMLNEAIDACKLPDNDMTDDLFIEDLDEEEKAKSEDDSHIYRLN